MHPTATLPHGPLLRAPLSYRIGLALIRRRWRGSSLLFDRLIRPGLARQVVRYPLTPTLHIDTPLFTDNLWDPSLLLAYEQQFVACMQALLAELPRPVRFVDCGASFGLFSLRMAQSASPPDEWTAFEPNPEMFALLASNLAQLGSRARCLPRAVSDWQGRGMLRSPEHDPSPDAMFLAPDPAGPIEVDTLDATVADVSRGALVLKIDVEGQELAVMRGARRLLERAPQVVVAFEAHPEVARRTGVDPVECLRILNGIRPFDVRIAECPDLRLDPDRPVFDQLRPARICNIVCRSVQAR